jgi:hypothetical protein
MRAVARIAKEITRWLYSLLGCHQPAGEWHVGGLQRPAPVVAMKRIHKTASIGFAEWREQAGQRLTDSTMKGTPRVYVIAKPRVPTRNAARSTNGKPRNVVNKRARSIALLAAPKL